MQTAINEQLSALFQREAQAVADYSYLDALRQQWKGPAIQAGFFPLGGIVTISMLPRDYRIHPLEYWRVERVSRHELNRFAVPAEAHEKLACAYTLGVPVKWLLWAEQYVTPPEVKYHQETVYVDKYKYRHYDPALIAVLRAGDDVGIPYLVHCWLHS